MNASQEPPAKMVMEKPQGKYVIKQFLANKERSWRDKAVHETCFERLLFFRAALASTTTRGEAAASYSSGTGTESPTTTADISEPNHKLVTVILHTAALVATS